MKREREREKRDTVYLASTITEPSTESWEAACMRSSIVKTRAID